MPRRRRNEEFITERKTEIRRVQYGPTHHSFKWMGHAVEDVGSRPGTFTFPVFDAYKIPADIEDQFRRVGCTRIDRHVMPDGKIGYTGTFLVSEVRWIRVLLPTAIIAALRREAIDSPSPITGRRSTPDLARRIIEAYVEANPKYALWGRDTSKRWAKHDEKIQQDAAASAEPKKDG